MATASLVVPGLGVGLAANIIDGPGAGVNLVRNLARGAGVSVLEATPFRSAAVGSALSRQWLPEPGRARGSQGRGQSRGHTAPS